MNNKEDLKKKVVTTATLASLSSSVLLGTAFDNPGEIVNYVETKQIPKVESVYLIENTGIFDEYEKDEETGGIKKSIHNLVYRLPVTIRALFCVPMWIIGSLLLFLLNGILKNVLSPISDMIINFIVSTLLSLLTVIVCIKILFSNLSLKKILNKRTILLVIFGNIIMFILDLIMPNIYSDYTYYRKLSKLIMGIIVIIITILPFIRLFIKKHKEPRIVIPKM